MVRKLLLAAISFLLLESQALAQSAPNWVYGYVPTVAEWNNIFALKQDVLPAPPLLTTGGVMIGELVTAVPTTASSGFNLPHGAAPTAPFNGDMWTTNSGLYVRINGVTIGPMAGASAASFAALGPLTLSYPSGVVTYGISTNAPAGVPLMSNANSYFNPITTGQINYADITSAPVTSGALSSGSAIANAGGASGHSYAPADLLTVNGGTGTAATFTVQTVQLDTASIVAAGSGYAINDIVQLLGGSYLLNAQIKVLSIGGGGSIATFSILPSFPGNYTGTLPTSFTTAAITGSGSGATLNSPIWGVATITLAGAGNYSAFPSNPVTTTSSTGTGATLTVAWGNAPPPLRTVLGYPSLVNGFTAYSRLPCNGYQFSGNVAATNSSEVNLYFCNNDPTSLYPGQSYTAGDQTTVSMGAAQNVTLQTTDSTRSPLNNATNVLNASLFNLYKLPFFGSSTTLLTAPANGSAIYSIAQGSSSFGTTSTCGVTSGGSANCAVDTNYGIMTVYVVNNKFTWDGSTPGSGALGRFDFVTPAGRANGVNYSVIDFGQGVYCGTGANGLLADQGSGNVNCLQFTISSSSTNVPSWTLRSAGSELAFYNNALAVDKWYMSGIDGGFYAVGASGGSKGSGTINALLYLNGSPLTSLAITAPGSGVTSAIGNSTNSAGGIIVPAAAGTNGQFLLGVTSSAPQWGSAISSSGSSAFSVGLNGATNPAFVVDASTALQAAGLKITGAVTGGTVAATAIDSGSNTNLTINAKGTGTIGIGSVSTGTVTITPNLIVGGSFSINAMTQTSAAQSGTVCYNSGTSLLTYDATLGCLTSTLSMKDHWTYIAPETALSLVLKMKPGSFTYKPGHGLPSGEQIGFNAEQIETVDDRLVAYNDEGGLRGVRYQQASALYSAAIQALKADNDNLREEISKLRKAN